MARFEILIELNGSKYQLDTYDTDPISLTYNVADISDISSRNSAFSKTIKIPESKNNRLIFGDIADLGVDASFNPNKKTKSWILVDTILVFEGYLQLRNVFVDKENDSAEYEVVIYADNDNFFKQLGDKFLTNLDFTELNHTWNASNVRTSWTSTWNKGYYYPLIDYGNDWDLGEVNGWTTTYNTEVKTTNMFPSTNVKYIVDKIFSDAGYTYQSNFLNSEVFTNLYVPFNKSKLVRSVTGTSSRFTIGRTQSATFSANIPSPEPSWSGIYYNDIYIIPDFYDAYDNYDVYMGLFPQSNQVQLTKTKVPFNNEASPDGDPDGLYNNTTYEYTAPVNFISGRFVCNFDITFNLLTNYNTNKQGGTLPSTSICFRRSRNPATGATVSGGVVIPINGSTTPVKFLTSLISGLQFDLGGKRVYGQISTDILDGSLTNQKKLYPGEKVWVDVEFGINSKSLRQQVGNSNLLEPYEIAGGVSYNTRYLGGSLVGTFSQSSKFFNILNENILSGETIEYNQVIPSNVKQKDFITSIIKMFNLYIEPLKDNDNVLYIEPRDDYYASGKIKDWTGKLDINQTIQEQILGETQNKKTTWKYKDDKDFYNEDYKKTKAGISYGEYQYFLDNDFISGEKKVEIIFSPTPLVPILSGNNETSLIIPKIGKINNNLFAPTEHNIRILTKFSSSTNKTWVYGDYQFMSGGNFNAYVVLTSNGFGNALHPFAIGDYVNVNQTDGGTLKPALQGNFKVVDIRDSKSIVINIPFSSVGSGIAMGGVVSPVDGLLPVANDGDAWSFEGVKYKAYPYLGHFNNPQTPTYDLNWGQTVGLYYGEDTVTNNNLYSVYWENQIKELSDKDSRIVTASFYLTAYDIADFRFNDNIYINQQYYKVNKIQNYDPTRETLVKVELIKTKFITAPRAFSKVVTPRDNNPIKNIVGLSKTDPVKPPRPIGVLSTSGTNVISKPGAIAVGKGNFIFNSSTAVIGNNNTTTGTKSLIVGDTNVSGANKSLIVGDNNIIGDNVSNVIVFGDNATVTESNTMVISTTIVVTSNYISASRNEVLNPFPDNKIINYLSGSRNAVRELGSKDITNYVSGGRFTQ